MREKKGKNQLVGPQEPLYNFRNTYIYTGQIRQILCVCVCVGQAAWI